MEGGFCVACGHRQPAPACRASGGTPARARSAAVRCRGDRRCPSRPQLGVRRPSRGGGGGNGAVHGAAAALLAAGIAARTRGKVLWCLTRADLFALSLSQIGLSAARVIYVSREGQGDHDLFSGERLAKPASWTLPPRLAGRPDVVRGDLPNSDFIEIAVCLLLLPMVVVSQLAITFTTR